MPILPKALHRIVDNRPINQKVWTGMLVMTAVSAGIGALALVELSALGTAVELTGRSMEAMGELNDANAAVGRFADSHSGDDTKAASSSLDDVVASLARLGPRQDPRLGGSYDAVDQYRGAIGALDRAAGTIKTALDDIDRAGTGLRATAAAAESAADAAAAAGREQALAATKLARGFDAGLGGLMARTLTYRLDPRSATVGPVQSALADLAKLAPALAQAGLPDPTPAARAFSQAFSTLRQATADLADARDSIGVQSDTAMQILQQLVKDRQDAATRARTLGLGLTAGGIAVALLLASFIAISFGRLIVRPIVRLNAAMVRLAAGDLGIAVDTAVRRDEIGQMSRTVLVFRDNAVAKQRFAEEAAENRSLADRERLARDAERAATVGEQAHVVEAIGTGLGLLADGVLTHRIDVAFAGQYETLRQNFNSVMDHFEHTIRQIAQTSREMESSTGEIADAAEDLSRRTEQQAASLEEVAAALDEITATVKTTTAGVAEARATVAAAARDAESSSSIVAGAVQAMGEIEKSSQKISQIIGVIDEIAFQTNLLALNAGVEAARAGDSGRGFAVVAAEVRALAQRSAEAAKEIKALISASASQVGEGVNLVGETGQALARIVRQVSGIDRVVGEIAASAQEQTHGLAEVNSAVNQMDQVTQQNAAMVQQSTAASRTLAHEAEGLGRLIGRFKVDRDAGRDVAPRHRGSAPRSIAA